ncbi:MAG: AI-2E family transporter [Bacteroidota bacterium]|nr:AI-2E family transporter [Bacteroidota bacterium]
MKKAILPFYAQAALVLIAVYLLIAGIIIARPLLVPMAIGALITTLLMPLAKFFEKNGMNRFFSSLLSVTLAISILVTIVFFIYSQMVGFVKDLPEIGNKLTAMFNSLELFIKQQTGSEVNLQVEALKQTGIDIIQNNTKSLTQFLLTIVGGIAIFLLLPVYIFMFLFYRDFLLEFVTKLFGNNKADYVRGIVLKIQTVSQKYVSGVFFVASILSIINAIVLSILGLEHALFFAVFAGFLNIIPYLGPMIGSLLPIAFAFLLKDTIWYSIGILIYFYVIQSIESYFITPAIVGKNVNINPLIIIVALIVGYTVWGIVGMVIVIPTVAILKIIFDEIEQLHAFGFLIGGVPSSSSTKNWLVLNISRFKKKISKA